MLRGLPFSLHPVESGIELFFETAVLDAVSDFSAFCIVEAVYRSYQISGYAANPLEPETLGALKLASAAAWTMVTDDAVVAADGIPVDRMVNGTVSDALFAHETDDLLKGLQLDAVSPSIST